FSGRWNGGVAWHLDRRRYLYVRADAVCRCCSKIHLQGSFERSAADQFPAEPMVPGCLVVTVIDRHRDFRSRSALPRSDFLTRQARQLSLLAAEAQAFRN